MSSGGTIDRMLDRIPGYAGYRDKERRRDSDRVIRDTLALDYGQLADRLGALARRLADERRILAVGIVDRPHKQLQSFINRVRTASYGYAPLFSDAPVDAASLDQLAAFDRALADQQEILSGQIDALEAADAAATEYKQLAAAIEKTIQRLDDRFDKRNEVLQSGKASSDPNVLALLESPSKFGPSVAFRIQAGEALSYHGDNYTVIAHVTAESPELSGRASQLRGGEGETWLLAFTDDALSVHWLNRVDIAATMSSPTVTHDGQTYTLDRQISGTGDVIGQGGTASKQPVRLLQYTAPDGSVLDIFDWGTSRLSLLGTRIDHVEIDFFTREK